MKSFKNFVIILLFIVCLFTLSACGRNEKTKIGILQISTHDALDSARTGIIESLEKNGYIDGDNIEIIYRNPEGDDNILTANSTYLVRNCDLVFAIATPAATALQSAAILEGINVPIIFTAVTDPITASLITSNEKPDGNITGTNDMNPIEDQIELLIELIPDIKKFGIIYNVKEVNSEVQASKAKKVAENNGIEVAIKTVADALEISTTVKALINDGAEAIYVPTDNLMASNMPAIASTCEELKIPVICGEEGMVKKGGTITYSISYFELGKITGEMGVKVLKGTAIKDIPVTSVDESGLVIVVNNENISKIGLELPESIKERLNK